MTPSFLIIFFSYFNNLYSYDLAAYFIENIQAIGCEIPYYQIY